MLFGRRTCCGVEKRAEIRDSKSRQRHRIRTEQQSDRRLREAETHGVRQRRDRSPLLFSELRELAGIPAARPSPTIPLNDLAKCSPIFLSCSRSSSSALSRFLREKTLPRLLHRIEAPPNTRPPAQSSGLASTSPQLKVGEWLSTRERTNDHAGSSSAVASRSAECRQRPCQFSRSCERRDAAPAAHRYRGASIPLRTEGRAAGAP